MILYREISKESTQKLLELASSYIANLQDTKLINKSPSHSYRTAVNKGNTLPFILAPKHEILRYKYSKICTSSI